MISQQNNVELWDLQSDLSQKVYAFGGLWNIKSEADIQTEMSIYQSKANSDEKNLFGKITHNLYPEIRKMPVNGKFGNENSTFHAGP